MSTVTEHTLPEAEAIIARMDVPTTMPEYGDLWLRIDATIWNATGGGADYQHLRDRLHKIYSDKALEARTP